MQKLASIKHLVWDWNGTLFHDSHLVHETASETLQQLGYGTVTFEQCQNAYTHPLKLFYERLVGRALTTAEMYKIDHVFHTIYYQQWEQQTSLMPGARAILDSWQQRGVTQSVLSLAYHDRLQLVVGRLKLTDYFVRIDGRITGIPGKKAESLVAHLAALNVSSATTLMIGDTVDDARAAQSVGAQSILLASGLQSRQTLETAGVPIIDSLDELFLTDLTGSADKVP